LAEAEALAILYSKNEARRQPVLNLQIARTYLTATDPEVIKHIRQTAMDELTKTKTSNTHHRQVTATKAMHRACAKCVLLKIPAHEGYEKKAEITDAARVT
jgi:hypothetical protein